MTASPSLHPRPEGGPRPPSRGWGGSGAVQVRPVRPGTLLASLFGDATTGGEPGHRTCHQEAPVGCWRVLVPIEKWITQITFFWGSNDPGGSPTQAFFGHMLGSGDSGFVASHDGAGAPCS